MGKTSIEWTDYSWPVVNGCRRVSAGCENCYAERLTATRLSKTPKYEDLALMGKNGPRWTGETRLWGPHLDMPLRLRKPSRIFVADMGDLFYEGVRDEDIAAIFGVMAACPQHTFQVLTKRPERMRRWFEWVAFSTYNPPNEAALARCCSFAGQLLISRGGVQARASWPLRNVWLGVSVEDQDTADERIPLLLEVPSRAIRFVSYEPALGPVQFDSNTLGCVGHLAETFGNPLINWVIVGGESGPRARPMDIGWARSTVAQCRAARTPCFVKQLGTLPTTFRRPPTAAELPLHFIEHALPGQAPMYEVRLAARKGDDMEEWPTDLRVREFPLERQSP